MPYRKKLIEVALPLEAINKESAREKSIRHGHPSTLHLWWARRPLAAARAVIFTSLIDDPDQEGVPQKLLELIDELPLINKVKDANIGETRREKLFEFIEKLVKWENSNNPEIIGTAQELIKAATDGNPPPLLDPFAGGGAIPLEAQRLGLEAHASDLNPIAVMINKAMIEIPPKFAGQPPVNPEAKANPVQKWIGAQGLAEDVRYYGEWMKQKAFEKIGHLYPKVKDKDGREHTVIAWIWARTVKCPNPACGCEMPLASSFELSKKKGKEVYIHPITEGNNIRYEVRCGKSVLKETVNRNGAICVCCGGPVELSYIREEGKKSQIGTALVAIVGEGDSGRLFFSPDDFHEVTAACPKVNNVPEGELPKQALGFRIQAYGMKQFSDLFTIRQQVALTTFCESASDVQNKIIVDGGTDDYAKSILVYLSFVVNKIADRCSSLCSWDISRESLRNTFGRQALQMIWDFAESNPFGNSSGCFDNAVDWVAKSINHFPASKISAVYQQAAQSDRSIKDVFVSTDPPYYDNIGYADLSDFFYIWLRKNLKNYYSDLFRTMLVPKTEELIANPFRFEGDMGQARNFFEDGMISAFKKVNTFVLNNYPVTVYYAFKQSERDADDTTASTGWETMLSAIIRADFIITGTWPMRTELGNRIRSFDSNALASSIVLVCRKRPADAPICTRRDFVNALKRELKPALEKLQASNIAPVDLAQSAIGPGMGVYSRYSQVLEADGKPMSVRSALQIINQELDLYFTEQDGELDRDSRFCIDLYTQYAFNDMKFGEADVLARAKNTSVDKLSGRGVLYAQKGVVRLLTREEIPTEPSTDVVWLLTQQLTKAMEKDGVTGAAKIVTEILTAAPEQAKALAYRLFTIAERKGWAQEAYAYNSLVIAWPDVQAKAADLQAQTKQTEQMKLF